MEINFVATKCNFATFRNRTKTKKKGTQDNACLFPYFKDSSMIMRPNSHGLSSQLFNVAREKWGSLVKSTCYVTGVISFARFPCFSRVTLKSWEECGYEATTELPYKLLCNSYEHHIYSAILLTASWLYTLKIHPSPRCLLGPEHSTCGNDFFLAHMKHTPSHSYINHYVSHFHYIDWGDIWMRFKEGCIMLCYNYKWDVNYVWLSSNYQIVKTKSVEHIKDTVVIINWES